jgi:hypothetical protein
VREVIDAGRGRAARGKLRDLPGFVVAGLLNNYHLSPPSYEPPELEPTSEGDAGESRRMAGQESANRARRDQEEKRRRDEQDALDRGKIAALGDRLPALKAEVIAKADPFFKKHFERADAATSVFLQQQILSLAEKQDSDRSKGAE